jgi:hypothetical protein
MPNLRPFEGEVDNAWSTPGQALFVTPSPKASEPTVTSTLVVDPFDRKTYSLTSRSEPPLDPVATLLRAE